MQRTVNGGGAQVQGRGQGERDWGEGILRGVRLIREDEGGQYVHTVANRVQPIVAPTVL